MNLSFEAKVMSSIRVLTICLVLGSPVTGQAADQHLEIWLLPGSDCGTCDLYRSFHDGYPTQLNDYPGRDAPIPVSVVSKAAIPEGIAVQFTPHEYWLHSLSVMVLDGHKVLYVANMSEASDVAHTHYPDAIMAPSSAADRKRAAHARHFYGEHFEATWYLGYFVDVALERREPYTSSSQEMLEETRGIDGVAPDNVILWGSASTPFGNSLYISERMHDIHQALEQVAGPSLHFISLYGNGADPHGT